MKSFGIPDDIHRYVLDHSNSAANAAAEQLAAVTRERFSRRAGMNVGADQGQFMQTLATAMGAKLIVEVGTFTGMSALWLASGLMPGGRMVCFDLVDTYRDTAHEAWQSAGIAEQIELRIGPAADGLAALPDEPHIDLAFIDADKSGYRTYLDLLLPRMHDRGVILVDNVLWAGRVLDESDVSEDTVALRAFNDHVAQRSDCDAVILTLGDGLTMIRPRR